MPTLAEALSQEKPVYGYYPHLNPKVANKPDTLNTPEARGKVAEALLSVAPGSGEAMSARDAWNASGMAGEALTAGNYGQAASEYGNLAAALLGAVPGAGVIARGTKRGADWMNRNLPEGVNRLADALMPSDPKNTMNMFAGPTAKTADHAALKTAQEMTASGAPREEVLRDTGWFQGGDGNWRFEIDDSGVLAREGRGSASEIMPHPDLYAAYPDLADVRTRVGFSADGSGLGGNHGRDLFGRELITVNDNGADASTSTLLHELQHAVQKREGVTSGADPNWARDTRTAQEIETLRGDLKRGVDEAIASGDPDQMRAARERDLIGDLYLDQKGVGAYQRNAGEVEAVNTQARAGLSAEQRQQTPPWQTQGVPDDLQIYGDHSLGQRLANSLGITDAREGQYGEALREFGGTFFPFGGAKSIHGTPTPWVGSRNVDRLADELDGATPRMELSPYWREMQGAEGAARADPRAIAAETARRQSERSALQRYLEMSDEDVLRNTGNSWRTFEDPYE